MKVGYCRAMMMMASLSLALLAGAASAQQNCGEGRLSNGECVNPGLAVSNRQTATIFSQPKISKTAFPVLPGYDRRFRYPNQLIPDQSKPAPAFSVSP
jgi:hypothetical protein